MRPVTLTIIVVLCAVIGSFLGAALYVHWPILSAEEVQRVTYVYHIQPDSGVDVATDGLRLGAVAPGGGSRRDVTVSAQGLWNVTTRFTGSGSEYLRSEPASAVMQDNATFTIVLRAPRDATYGEYTGEAQFILQKVNS